MSTKSILINYAGYPYAIGSLTLDDGLAVLAACLLRSGHETKIFDYMTIDTFSRLFPVEYGPQIQGLITKIMEGIREGKAPCKDDLAAFYSLDAKVDNYKREKVAEIAKEISDYANKKNLDWVGLKLWMGEGFEGSIQIAERLKTDNPNLKIFAGGSQVDWYRELILQRTDAFDALAYGEGEETIVGLAEYVEGRKKLEDIPNLIFKQDGEIKVTALKRVDNLNSAPLPLYDENIYLAMAGDNKIKIPHIEEVRGCPNRCNFCLHPIKSGGKPRSRDPKVIIGLLKQLRDKGIRNFRFSASSSSDLREQIATEILREDISLNYAGFGHARPDLNYELLKRSGNQALFFGMESGSQYLLDRSINKRITTEQIRYSIRECKKAGIAAVTSWIIPAPLETAQTKAETLELILQERPSSVNVSIPGLIRGTEWEENAKHYGIEIADKEALDWYSMNYKIKYIIPPILRQPFMQKLNGKAFKEYATEASQFIAEVEKNGILTQVSDDMFLMAKHIGMPIRQFRDTIQDYISTGNYAGLKEVVRRINN